MNQHVKIKKRLNNKLINWRRELHKIPEVGLDLPQTESFLINELQNIGLDARNDYGCSGITAFIETDKNLPTIALRVDMDGLPINEETGLSYSSNNEGKMHACGHDAHMAVGLAVAEYLFNNRHRLKGNVKLIFQPGEEGPGGADLMIKNNVLEEVDSIIGFHIGMFDYLKPGQVGISYKPLMACLDKFSIDILGKGSHGGMPHTSIDPIVISSSIIQELQSLISRELNPTHPGVITIGVIEGGTSYNVIPEKVRIEGTARFIYEEDRSYISNRMKELLENSIPAKGGDVKFDYIYGYPPVVNDQEFTKHFEKNAKSIVGEDNLIHIEKPTMAGEDMAYYLKEIPGTYFFLGGLKDYQHHNSKFDINEDALKTGVEVIVSTIYDWLNNNS